MKGVKCAFLPAQRFAFGRGILRDLMKIRKNIRALLLSAIAICGSMFPAYAASGVTSGSMSIAGTDAKISTITMDGDRTFEVLVANDSIDTHESGKSMVSRAKDDGDVVAAINGGFFNMKKIGRAHV